MFLSGGNVSFGSRDCLWVSPVFPNNSTEFSREFSLECSFFTCSISVSVFGSAKKLSLVPEEPNLMTK